MARQLTDLRILAVLALGEMSGYEIYKQLTHDAEGAWLTGDWAVYRELPSLVRRSLIVPVDSALKPIRYQLTLAGRRQLKLEGARLEQIVRLIKQRL